jgi:hypothetical protein
LLGSHHGEIEPMSDHGFDAERPPGNRMKRRHFLQSLLGLPAAAIVGRAAQATPSSLRARGGPLKPADWAIDVPIGPEGPRNLWRVSWDDGVPLPRGMLDWRYTAKISNI